MMPPYRLQFCSKKWRGFHPLTLRCAAFGYNELRPRQSADVIAHCPLSIKNCTFESESNDSYVSMLLYCFTTMLDKDKYFSEIRFSTYSKLIITGLTALNNTITANIFLSAVRWHSGNIYLRRKLNLQ